MDIKLFGHSDVGEARELSDAAGWNQIEADWHRIVDHQPDGCLGVWVDGRLVGTTTFVIYGGTLAWIGMVLVRPDARGRGIGTRLVERAMEILGERDASVVGLDATEAGRPLYERQGFEEVTPIIRWSGTLENSSDAAEVATLPPEEFDALAAFDRKVAGIDRSQLLRLLFDDEQGSCLWSHTEGEGLRGYVFLRPGRTAWQLGPCVARSDDAARHLLAAAGRVLGDRNVIVDSVDGHGFPALLEAAGLEPSRHLLRMTAPEAVNSLVHPSIVAAAGFEWG